MGVEIINRILMLLFFMASLTTIRHIYYFIQAFFTSTEEQPKKYVLTNTSLILLGVSIAYILSSIFSGITL